MKIQDVLLKAMAQKITWWKAAEIIGVTDRTMILDWKPSWKRVPLAVAEQDLNIKHCHEKLRAEHQIALSYTCVRLLCSCA